MKFNKVAMLSLPLLIYLLSISLETAPSLIIPIIDQTVVNQTVVNKAAVDQKFFNQRPIAYHWWCLAWP